MTRQSEAGRRKRSAIMRAVKARNTKPELAVRKVLWRIVRGYRLHCDDLPGKPDIVFRRKGLAMFVHGCFWHGHSCKRGSRVPKSNVTYWTHKIARNRLRDRANRKKLLHRGWKLIVVWECELKNMDALSDKLRLFLGA